jgi:hypothetical protein
MEAFINSPFTFRRSPYELRGSEAVNIKPGCFSGFMSIIPLLDAASEAAVIISFYPAASFRRNVQSEIFPSVRAFWVLDYSAKFSNIPKSVSETPVIVA